jgi:hypothetical protein
MNEITITRPEQIFIVKSFGPENGYVNLKTFLFREDAEKFCSTIQKQIPDDIEDEFVEIEEMTLL